jgi:pimeloyl-ACP methyl ester carboxylesterase
MDHSCWLYQMAHLSTWFRTVGIDLPGYGRSPKARTGLTMTDLAQACWEAVDDVTREPAIVVGLSTGSGVAMYMAQQRADRTLALVVSGARYRRETAGSQSGRAAKYAAEGLDHRYRHTLEDFSPAFRQTEMAQYFARLFQERNAWTDANTYRDLVAARSDPEPDWMHEGIRAPTLIIAGSEDKQYRSSLELQKHIRGAEHVTMHGAGHACNMERPWEWDKHFLDFLTRNQLFE